MDSAEDDVDPHLAVRKLVLQQHFHVAQAGVDQIPEQHRQAVLPGAHLGGARPGARVPGLLLQVFDELTVVESRE
ncbi:hypothetical protein GCM10018954_055160 [Kutzneria kofuensis]